MGYVIFFILILIFYIVVCTDNIEGFTSSKDEKVDLLLESEKVLRSNYTASRNKISWMDPVIYNDVRNLINKNKFSRDNLIKII